MVTSFRHKFPLLMIISMAKNAPPRSFCICSALICGNASSLTWLLALVPIWFETHSSGSDVRRSDGFPCISQKRLPNAQDDEFQKISQLQNS